MANDPEEDKFVKRILSANRIHGKQAQVTEEEARTFYREKQRERKGRKTRRKKEFDILGGE